VEKQRRLGVRLVSDARLAALVTVPGAGRDADLVDLAPQGTRTSLPSYTAVTFPASTASSRTSLQLLPGQHSETQRGA
jgi:hypothetical protein